MRRAAAKRPRRRARAGEPAADPFREERPCTQQLRLSVLGARFHFESDSASLLRLVRHACARLPPHLFGARAPRLSVRLIVTPAATSATPALVQAIGTAGILAAATAGSALMAVVPQERRALVALPPALLRFPYHVRYELIEFAAYMLAARTQGLVPLHGACVGQGGAGALLLGGSGAGKSTLALQSLLTGLEFVAEDSVLVRPAGLKATGLASFLHVRPDSLRFVSDKARRRALQGAPVIRRRSGVRKLEIDLREGGFRLARTPLPLRVLIFLSPAPAGAVAMLRRLTPADAMTRLASGQAYGAGQSGWRPFARAAARLPAFELRRAEPLQQVGALRELLARVGR